MTAIYILLGFFLANILGYGGGPASIPLMYQEIVKHYQWLTNVEFSKMLALANALPGPIATKIAAYTGYQVMGWWGLLLALIATILPSAAALILLLKIISKHRQSSAVKGMTLLVQPVIAVMMAVLTWQMFSDSYHSLGWIQAIAIGLVSLIALTKLKLHPAFIILAAFIYGGGVLPLL